MVTPQNRFGRQGAAYLATWLTDVGLAADNRPVDQVVSLRYPSYAVRHPRTSAGSTTGCASTYDRWPQFARRSAGRPFEGAGPARRRSVRSTATC